MRQFATKAFPLDLSQYDLIIDARSEDEFLEDSVPGAINLPVLNNLERIEVGTTYKSNAFQASRQGAALISRNIANYLDSDLAKFPHTTKMLVYCWRGNQRSRAFAHILSSIGWQVTLLDGGYRHFRNFVIEQVEELICNQQFEFRIVSGYTGSGKTHLLDALRQQGKQVLDLEALANHKGSLFGSPAKGSQPSQKAYENSLWQELSHFDPAYPIYVESESNRIGSLFCPAPLWKQLKTSTVIEISLPFEERVKIIRRDYPHLLTNANVVIKLLEKLVRLRGHEQVNRWKEQVTTGQWDDFIRSILEHHYDIAYKAAGEEGSSYNSPSSHIEVSAATTEAFATAAEKM